MTRIATETLTMPQTKTTINLSSPSGIVRRDLAVGTLFVYQQTPDQVRLAVDAAPLGHYGTLDVWITGGGTWNNAMRDDAVIVLDAAFTRSEV